MAAPTPPTFEPISIVAGDTVQWTRVVSDYPASDGWTLKYVIKGPDTITGVTATVATTGEYAVTFAASATTGADAGVYRLFGWVETAGATQRHTVYDEPLTILPNVATLSGDDLLTQAEQELAAVDEAILNRLTIDLASYTSASASVVKIELADLRRQRGILKAAIWRERNPGRYGPLIVMSYGGSTAPSAWE